MVMSCTLGLMYKSIQRIIFNGFYFVNKCLNH